MSAPTRQRSFSQSLNGVRLASRRKKKFDPAVREYLRLTRWAMVQARGNPAAIGYEMRAIILLMFRHGLRTAELVALRWHQVDLKAGYSMCIGSSAVTTPNILYEARSFACCGTPAARTRTRLCLCVGAQGAPVSTLHSRDRGESRQAGGTPLHAPSSPTGHACGYYLASHGHDTRAIQTIWGTRTFSTPCATRNGAHRFENFWTD